MSVKIVLDHNALEALFKSGSDDRLELQRHAVIEFAKRHIKDIVNDQLFKTRMDAMEKSITAELVEQGLTASPFNSNLSVYHIDKSAKEAIRERVALLVNDEVTAQINKQVSEVDVADIVHVAIHNIALPKLQKQMDRAVLQRLKAMQHTIQDGLGDDA